MKKTVLYLALLLLTPVLTTAQVGIGTLSPATTLHLFNETDHPVLRLEAGNSAPISESGRLDWVYNQGGTGKGCSMRLNNGEFWITRLSDGSLGKQDYPALRFDPQNLSVNVGSGTGQVTRSVNLSVNGSFAAGNRTITSDYTMPVTGVSEDYVILADATAGNVTVTLCSATGQKGRLLVIKKIAGVNMVIIDAFQSETIDGSFNYIISAQYQYISIQSDGSNWFIIGK